VRRVGILGGTFNPPHLGHLAIARDAGDELGLDPVLLIPANVSPDKVTAKDPGSEHRLRMCGLLVKDAGGLSACALEIERGGRSYTVDTLEAIHASHPDAELTFIIGADAARTLPAWREPAKLLELADLAVATRGETGRREVLDVVAELIAEPATPAARPRARVSFLETPLIGISSSIVRGRVARGEEIDDLVGGAVAGYIAEQRLYRSPPEAGG
jgi:nicotinate-nucleotide adenylyltransferase